MTLAVLFLLTSCVRTVGPEPQALTPEKLKNRYLVTLDPDFAPGGHAANKARAADIARGFGLEPFHTYGTAVFGFAVEIPDGRVTGLQNDPRVLSVEPDQVLEITAQTFPTGIPRIYAPDNPNLGLDETDFGMVDVDIAILDTGILTTHEDLNVASKQSFSTSIWCEFFVCDGEDDHGHGTHVAGTAAALHNTVGIVGVAPGARLHAVKVLDAQGGGAESDVTAGIDWVAANADMIEVANMSLGCACDTPTMDVAITNAVAAGVVFVVAAGNEASDAGSNSPAKHPDVITVSALADFDGAPGGLGSPSCRIDVDDTNADFSNFDPSGSVIDIAAPGVCINSTYFDGGYIEFDGTSMASPHVAGAAAILASTFKPQNRAEVMDIRDIIVLHGNFDWQDLSGDGFLEPLLDVGSTADKVAEFCPKLVGQAVPDCTDGSPNPGKFSFTSTFYTVEEGNTEATITVRRTRGNIGAVTVEYGTSNGTASSGSDYTSTSGNLSWADGETGGKTFTISIKDDRRKEDDETVLLTLSNPTGGATLGNSSSTLTILDNEKPGTLTFTSTEVSANERDGSVTVTVKRTGGDLGEVSVDYTTIDDTATAPSDYVATSGTLTWLDNDFADKSFTVDIINDELEEPAETVTLSLSNPTGGASLGDATSTLTIAASDQVGTLTFTSEAFTVDEGDGVVAVMVTRSGGDEKPVSIEFYTQSGGAVAGEDFTSTTVTVSWADGESGAKTVNIPIIDDVLDEVNEAFWAKLRNVAGAGTLSFASGTYSVDEGAGTVSITVERVGGSSGAVSVQYDTSDGTATSADYTPASGTLSWVDGDSLSKSFTVSISEDTDVEGDESVSMLLSNPTGGAALGTDTSTLTIMDNDVVSPGVLSIENAAYTVNEGAGMLTVTVTRSSGSAGAVEVDYLTADVVALAGSDYVATSGTLSWADGETSSKSFDVAITDDGDQETNEVFQVLLSTLRSR
jgi:subtilisin family serine protease